MRILFFILFSFSLKAQGILLETVNETLEIATSTTAAIDVQINWVDIVSATGATEGATETKIVTATTTTVLPAPIASTFRHIKSVSICNISTTTANVVTVKKDISATEYCLKSVTLSAGDNLNYEDGRGWIVYDATGREKVYLPQGSGYTGYSSTFMKTGTASDAVSYQYCTSKDVGLPSTWAVGTSGVNGRTTDGTSTADAGCVYFKNAATGSIYLKSIAIQSTIAHLNEFFDVVWVNNALVVTTTTEQTFTTPSFPARDINGSSNGEGYQIGLLFTGTATNVAVNNTATVRYTNSANTGTRTATLSANVGNQIPATALVGTIVWFNLQAGDTGVRSIQGITLATSLGAGSISLIVARKIASIGTPAINTGYQIDFGYGIKLYSGTCLLHDYISQATTATTVMGQLYFEEK